MKRILALILCCMMLAGCSSEAPAPTQAPTQQPTEFTQPPTQQPTESTSAPQETTAPTEEAPSETAPDPTVNYRLYLPDENAENFVVKDIQTGHITADGILGELQANGVLPESVIINAFGADGNQLNIDFNSAFGDLVSSMGTSGERMIIGSVVNTYLNAFQAESVFFTVEGEILESGHVVYDFPITFVE